MESVDIFAVEMIHLRKHGWDRREDVIASLLSEGNGGGSSTRVRAAAIFTQGKNLLREFEATVRSSTVTSWPFGSDIKFPRQIVMSVQLRGRAAINRHSCDVQVSR